MRILIAIIDGFDLQQRAEVAASSLQTETTGSTNFSGDVVVTVFAATKRTPTIVRCEYFRRYDRIEVDVECDFPLLGESDERLTGVLGAALRHGLATAGFPCEASQCFSSKQLALAGRVKESGGVYLVTVLATPDGLGTVEALKKIEQWGENFGGVTIDGEVEISDGELQVFLSSTQSISRPLEKFVRKEFSGNGVLVVDPSERIICQW